MPNPPITRPPLDAWPHRSATQRTENLPGEQGYLLIGLVVAIFLITLFLTIAAPTVAKQLERDRELESQHRAQQYVQAIHNYYVKFKTYPNSVDQLLSQNDIHFLRQQYKDPLTGGDYRLIHYGEAKTQVKGFFGEPLEGGGAGSLGSLAGSASSQGGAAGSFGGAGFGAPAGAPGGGSAGGNTSSFGNSFSSGSSGSGAPGSGTSPFGNSFSSGSGAGGSSLGGPAAPGGSAPASGGTAPASGGSPGAGDPGTNASGTLGGNSATTFQGSKSTIVGVGSSKTGPGILEWNGSPQINDWEFLYDPRVDILKSRVSLLGGAPGANGSGSFGSPGGTSNSLGSNTPSFGPGASNSPSAPGGAAGSPTGTSPGTGGFGGGGFGSGTGTTTPTTP